MNLLIVTPLFKPAQGGASTYYDLLVQELIKYEEIDRVTILTSQHPGARRSKWLKDGRAQVIRLFSNVAGAKRQPWLQYPKYAYRNFQYLRIPKLLREEGIDVALVHASFHNYPNLMRFVVGQGADCKWVADVRDHLMPDASLPQLERYDNIIACSRNVLQHISQHGALESKIEYIPVIQEPLRNASPADVEQFRRSHGLPDHPYLSYVGLVKPEKGVDLLLDTFEILASRKADLYLVLAGQMKDTGDCQARIRAHPRIHYLGEISRNDVLTLVKGAALNVNLSPAEGLPRSSLEALEVGGQVALPPNIPEFEEYCSEHVVQAREARCVASKLQHLLCEIDFPVYPVERHRPEHVIPKYIDLFSTMDGVSH